MNESDIELLRIRLGSAMIFLFKAREKYRSDDDLARVFAAIEQADAILGPVHLDDCSMQETDEEFHVHAEAVAFNVAETKHSYGSAICGRGRHFSEPGVSARSHLDSITMVLSRWWVIFRLRVKPAAHFDVMTKRS